MKGGRYADKHCPHCNLGLTESTVDVHSLVTPMGADPRINTVPFIDGDDIAGRYVRVRPSKVIELGCSDIDYKADGLYTPPKLLVRQAGVGVSATLDNTNSRCPQSVYLYRLKGSAESRGYSLEFVLASLLSRTMAYVVFKKFGEVDAARAFSKLTLTRLGDLPIPTLHVSDSRHRSLHGIIQAGVGSLLSGATSIGSRADLEIEQALRELWGLGPEDGARINRELADLPSSKILDDLAPIPSRRTSSGLSG